MLHVESRELRNWPSAVTATTWLHSMQHGPREGVRLNHRLALICSQSKPASRIALRSKLRYENDLIRIRPSARLLVQFGQSIRQNTSKHLTNLASAFRPFRSLLGTPRCMMQAIPAKVTAALRWLSSLKKITIQIWISEQLIGSCSESWAPTCWFWCENVRLETMRDESAFWCMPNWTLSKA